MKIQLFVLTILVYINLSCGSTNEDGNRLEIAHSDKTEESQESIILKNFSITQIDSTEYTSTQTISNPFQKDSSFIRSNENKLTIQTDKKGQLTFNDSLSENDETESFKYFYEGYNKNLNHYLIKKELYEGEEFLLIDKKNGAIKKVWNLPVISQNGNLIFSKQSDLSLVYDDVPLGFQIWQFTDEGLKKIEEVELNDQLIIGSMWTSLDELLIKQIKVSDYLERGENSDLKFEYYKLKKK